MNCNNPRIYGHKPVTFQPEYLLVQTDLAMNEQIDEWMYKVTNMILKKKSTSARMQE